MKSVRIAQGLGLLLALSGCIAEPHFASASREGVSPQLQAACHQQAETSYRTQNRGEIYRTDTFAASSAGSPFSNAGLHGGGTQSLSSEYAYQQYLADCYNQGATPTQSNPVQAAPQP